MFKSTDSFPVFPLPIFMLPGGMQRLRIFEQKYLSMVAHANQTDGFIISLFRKDDPHLTSDWGAHVRIVDFDEGDDGILTVDVLAHRLVTLSSLKYKNNGLLTANVETIPHWSSGSTPSVSADMSAPTNYEVTEQNTHQQLSFILQRIFNENDELNNLYKNHYFDYAEWVSARLLEIIPLPLNEKELFVQKLDFQTITTLLSSLCKEEEKSDPLF